VRDGAGIAVLRDALALLAPEREAA
jgi:hypothetical protein